MVFKVHTRLHENYFSVQKTYDVHKICFDVREKKLKHTLGTLELQINSKNKIIGVFFLKPCSRHYEKIVYWGAQILFTFKTSDLYICIQTLFK